MNMPLWDIIYGVLPSICGSTCCTTCCIGYVSEEAGVGEEVVAAASKATKTIFSVLTKLV
jgi:hypothetical protein